ncbi:hypothetical protein VP01_818g4 [Puccinia sorghi]|uniref:Uncharacterized protein n=1 Tax=Puccinia sorghi TaxID=27349 RepID=A0A0L6UA15_9BASI|nr:hypothetical protein VP01_818g4 [Puccinia sorghi]
MRHSFIYCVLHLSTFSFFTAATPPGWNEAQSKTCLPFDLNFLPAEEIPPESLSSSDLQLASSPVMEKPIAPSRFTPEELAANNHVFPGLRSLLSADVDSASSHGCDHRGYPLAQQSSSIRFSSTSAGKRKTSDSSSGSTSKRYKPDDTSDRYESYDLINQHFSVETSVSNVTPTSSKPGYVLPTEKNPREEIGKLKEKEVAVRTGLEANKEAGMLFNVYDWDFLREYPESAMADDHQHQLLTYLNQCKGASDVESFFFIQKDRTDEFLTEFASRKRQWEFINFPSEICSRVRQEMLFKTLLRISDKKINLEGFAFFKDKIIGGMRGRLETNFKTTQNPSSPKIETIMRFVQAVTKVTQLLIVVHLSLFKEHEQEVLTVEEVEKNLKFFQELWFQIDDGTPEIQKIDWAKKAHKIFRFQNPQHHFLSIVFKKDRMYNFCWNLVSYWREQTGRSLRGFYGPFHTTLQELVNKIIFFSNYKSSKFHSLSAIKPKEFKERQKI